MTDKVKEIAKEYTYSIEVAVATLAYPSASIESIVANAIRKYESAEIERLQEIIERAKELTYLYYGEPKKNIDIRQVLNEAKKSGE